MLTNSRRSDLSFIAVEGPIGVGKTTLAKRLAATYGTDLILQSPVDNPFLPSFYADPQRFALATQLSFLFQHCEQIKSITQSDFFRPVQIADYLFAIDRLYAQVNLSAEELRLYEMVYEQVSCALPAPDLVIYLQAPWPVLTHRINRRGIAYEDRIGHEYLERLCIAYVEFFHQFDSAPLLTVNAANVDLASCIDEYHMLLDLIDHGISGHQYLNPSRV